MPPPEPPAPTRVLLVDDDEWVGFSTQPLLEELGYEVDWVLGGRQALERFAPGRYAFVLVDYRLNGMNGVELLRHLLGRDAEVKAILCTGMPRTFVDETVFNEGAVGFLDKPWPLEDLLRQVAFIGAEPPPRG
ncbi:MAG: response regulator [Myxococcota bacterium]